MNSFAQIRIVLVAERQGGAVDFDRAWYRALRQILPPEDCAPALRAEHEETKQILRETKPWWRASWEGRDVKPDERRRSDQLARRRVADLSDRLAA